MNHVSEPPKKHDGRNVKRIREIMGMKQSALAQALGEEWNQKKVSQLEDKETIDDKLIEEIAGALQVSVEAIRNFDEQRAINIFSNTYHDNSSSVRYSFNPIDKIVALYEALVQSEKEKVEIIQRILDERK